MSAVTALHARPATPWLQEVQALAGQLARRLHDGVNGTALTLWLGGGYSEVLELCGPGAPGASLVADPHSRVLGQGRRGLPAARTLQLTSLADLRRDTASIDSLVSGTVLHDSDAFIALQEKLFAHFRSNPAVADGCVGNLVMDFCANRIERSHLGDLLSEAFRVLARSGRVFCLVAMTDEPLEGRHLLSGAPAGPGWHLPDEGAVVRAFEEAGFHGMALHWSRAEAPAVDRIGDVEVRICLLEAYKGKQGECLELGQAVMYSGPWREVRDDDGHVYPRGQRVAVCAKTYDLLMRAPYAGSMMGLRSRSEPPLEQAEPFDCNTPALRSPRVTKGLAGFAGATAAASCIPGEGCC